MNCPQFIVQSLTVRTRAHLLHLSSKSYAQHMALGEFYEALNDLTDKYAEVYMGLNSQITSWPGPATVELRDPVTLLEDYLELVLAEQAEDSESEALSNILAELEEVTARALYRLRFFK